MSSSSGGSDPDRVAEAFAAVDRAQFLPEGSRHLAGADRPVRIGWEQTCSQPSTVAAMLRLLDVQPRQRVLDVGSGSGWTTALLAHLVGPEGEVLGLELVPELVAFGAANLRSHLADVDGSGVGRARIEAADPGGLGRPDEAPWDRVLVSAGADALPEALVEQLAEDGVLVVPVAGTMTRVVWTGAEAETTRHGLYSFVPLR